MNFRSCWADCRFLSFLQNIHYVHDEEYIEVARRFFRVASRLRVPGSNRHAAHPICPHQRSPSAAPPLRGAGWS